MPQNCVLAANNSIWLADDAIKLSGGLVIEFFHFPLESMAKCAIELIMMAGMLVYLDGGHPCAMLEMIVITMIILG